MHRDLTGKNHIKKPWLIFFLCLALILVPVCFTVDRADANYDLVKVCLRQNNTQTSFNLEGDYQLVDQATGQLVGGSTAGQSWHIVKEGSLLGVYLDDQLLGRYSGPLATRQSGGGSQQISVISADGVAQTSQQQQWRVVDGLNGATHQMDHQQHSYYAIDGVGAMTFLAQQAGPQLNLICLNSPSQPKRYRGDLHIIPTATGFNLVNVLHIEQYLYGVLPCEMPASFHMEALKAQTIAARSYLLTAINKKSSSGFDILDSQTHQVYGGYDQEHPRTNQAVDATAGLVATYANEPIDALYHASSGGYTENSEDVYINPVPYLKTKPDPADYNDKHYQWQANFTNQQLTNIINRQSPRNLQGQTMQLSTITGVQIKDYTASGYRAKNLLFTGVDNQGATQQVVITGADNVRQVLGLKSALFTIYPEFDEKNYLMQVKMIGHGLGHGVGLSQWGAQGLAQQGYNYQQILSYYYTDILLATNYGY